MTDMLSWSAPVLLMAGMERTATKMQAGLYCKLPNAEDFSRIYVADPRQVDEACAFYDDLLHDFHMERNLLELAVGDLCQVHPSLW